MNLISVTLVGPGTAKHIAPLVSSLTPLTTRHMFVLWNAGEEERAACERYHTRVLSVPEGDFGAARNQALEFARVWGDASHALMIDTDERLLLPPEMLDDGERWKDLQGDVLRIFADNGRFRSPRIFSLPVRGEYRGRAHEYFEPAEGASSADWRGPEIVEVPKSSEELERKWRRDLRVLQEDARRDPLEIRWRFYLGETYRGLGWLAKQTPEEAHELLSEAALWYLSAMRLVITSPRAPTDWEREQGGWAAYRAACTLNEMGNPAAAISAACDGLEACSWLTELPWVVAFLRFGQQKFLEAARWANLASLVGQTGPARVGFTEPTCKPHELRGFALRALGDPEGDNILRECGVLP